jgi:hypothetical protein
MSANHGVATYNKAQVLKVFLLEEETSAVRTQPFGASEERF